MAATNRATERLLLYSNPAGYLKWVYRFMAGHCALSLGYAAYQSKTLRRWAGLEELKPKERPGKLPVWAEMIEQYQAVIFGASSAITLAAMMMLHTFMAGNVRRLYLLPDRKTMLLSRNAGLAARERWQLLRGEWVRDSFLYRNYYGLAAAKGLPVATAATTMVEGNIQGPDDAAESEQLLLEEEHLEPPVKRLLEILIKKSSGGVSLNDVDQVHKYRSKLGKVEVKKESL